MAEPSTCEETDTGEERNSIASYSTSSTTLNFLDKLRAPKHSEICRKRKVHTNPPPVGKKRSVCVGKYDPRSVRPSQRASEFPSECLVDSAGKLFCKACRENIAIKRSVVQNHIKSKKHEDGKIKLKLKEARENDIAEALHKHDSETRRKGETLPTEQNVYRAKVVMTLMKCGIPLSKLFEESTGGKWI